MQQFLNTNVKLEASAIKKTSLSKKVWHQNCVNWVFWEQFGKTIAIFEISILKFVKKQSYVQNLNNKFTTKNALFAGLWAEI